MAHSPHALSAFGGHRPGGGALSWVWGAFLWVFVAAFSLALLPARTLSPGDAAFFASLGFIAIWRWLWGLLHLLRAFAWTKVAFPRIRALAPTEPFDSLAVVVLSYGMERGMALAVATALARDVAHYGVPTRVVVSAESRAAGQRWRAHFLSAVRNPSVQVEVLVQDGSGKRRAMSEALAHLRRSGMPTSGAVLLMDGDTLVPHDTLARTAPILMMDEVGAVTVDNQAFVDGPAWVRDWYALRMAQRHAMMSSLALSERVLVLTGRWSLFRATLALHPDFAAQIQEDGVGHWRLGRIPMLTGEDKSTWRWVTARGWKTLYVPDVQVHPLEKLPRLSFFGSSVKLMLRWFGNMARGGARALRMGPAPFGPFAYLTLIDQRISMWTTLTGLVFFTLAALLHDMAFFAVYALWVLLSRTVHSLALAGMGSGWSPLHPFHLYYGQIVGSVVKILTLFRPDVQGWTRQGTGRAARRGAWSSTLLMAATLCLFVASVAAFSGVMSGSKRWEIRTEDIPNAILRGERW